MEAVLRAGDRYPVDWTSRSASTTWGYSRGRLTVIDETMTLPGLMPDVRSLDYVTAGWPLRCFIVASDAEHGPALTERGALALSSGSNPRLFPVRPVPGALALNTVWLGLVVFATVVILSSAVRWRRLRRRRCARCGYPMGPAPACSECGSAHATDPRRARRRVKRAIGAAVGLAAILVSGAILVGGRPERLPSSVLVRVAPLRYEGSPLDDELRRRAEGELSELDRRVVARRRLQTLIDDRSLVKTRARWPRSLYLKIELPHAETFPASGPFPSAPPMDLHLSIEGLDQTIVRRFRRAFRLSQRSYRPHGAMPCRRPRRSRRRDRRRRVPTAGRAGRHDR